MSDKLTLSVYVVHFFIDVLQFLFLLSVKNKVSYFLKLYESFWFKVFSFYERDVDINKEASVHYYTLEEVKNLVFFVCLWSSRVWSDLIWSLLSFLSVGFRLLYFYSIIRSTKEKEKQKESFRVEITAEREKWDLLLEQVDMISLSRSCWLEIQVLVKAACFSVSFPALSKILLPPSVFYFKLSVWSHMKKWAEKETIVFFVCPRMVLSFISLRELES